MACRRGAKGLELLGTAAKRPWSEFARITVEPDVGVNGRRKLAKDMIVPPLDCFGGYHQQGDEYRCQHVVLLGACVKFARAPRGQVSCHRQIVFWHAHRGSSPDSIRTGSQRREIFPKVSKPQRAAKASVVRTDLIALDAFHHRPGPTTRLAVGFFAR
jgi:hypothetical protein